MSSSIQTYDELVETAADFMTVDAADVVIPKFIRLAESQFERRLRIREMEKQVSYLIGSDDTDLPTDFLEIRSLVTKEGCKLEYVALDEIESRRALTGGPRVFSIYGETLQFWPVPESTSPVEARLRYYSRIAPLSAEQPVNSILTNHPDLYLYGTLVQSAGYLKDPNMIGTWGPLFEAAVMDANKSARRIVGQRLSMKPSGAPV